MDDQLHIIIAGDKGKVFKLPFSTKKLFIGVTSSIVVLFALGAASIYSFSLYTKNRSISDQLAGLQEKLHNNTELIAIQSKLTEEQRRALELKVIRLELAKVEQATTFQEEKEYLISTAINELNARSELIERVIGNIGIKIPQDRDSNATHSGGPFVQQPDEDTVELPSKSENS